MGITRRARTWTAVVTATVAIVVSVPTAVWASHRFGDIPTNSPLHEPVDKVTRAGIIRGCGSTGLNFCPNRTMTRGEQAQQLSRGLTSLAYGGVSGALLEPKIRPSDPDTLLNTVRVAIPGVAGAQQRLKIDASITALIDDVDCPCTVSFYLYHSATERFSQVHGITLEELTVYDDFTVAGAGNTALTWVISVPAATQQTIAVYGRVEAGQGDVTATAEMTATVAPFDAAAGIPQGASTMPDTSWAFSPPSPPRP